MIYEIIEETVLGESENDTKSNKSDKTRWKVYVFANLYGIINLNTHCLFSHLAMLMTSGCNYVSFLGYLRDNSNTVIYPT